MTIQFASPRFAGDGLLESILNAPDTGLLKLQPGSPPDSVRRLQQALFDLCWTRTLNPPVTTPTDFVIGIYGPKTTATVLLYKSAYDISFPATGAIDGLAGPRTFSKLDPQCVLLDEAIAAIAAKVADLRAGGRSVDLLDPTFRTTPLPGTSGTATRVTLDGYDGAILYKRGIGAHEVHGPIYDTYTTGGFAGGPWGFPTSDQFAGHDPWLRISDFEHGHMNVNVDTGEVEQWGPDPAPPQVGLF